MNAILQSAPAAVRYAQPAEQSELDRLLQRQFTPRDLLEDDNFNKIWRMAEALANSALSIPKELKGNIGDCMAIVTQAMMWGLNPFAVAQKAHVINGKLGYEAQLVNAVVMQSGAIRGHFHYEYEGSGQNLRCRVGAVLAGEDEITWGEFYGANEVQVKNSPLWKTNPKQQLGYLQVKNWARAFAPGALLGIYSTDELADGGAEFPTIDTPTPRGPQRKSATATAAPSAPDPETGEVDAPAPPPATQAPAQASRPAPDTRGKIGAGQVAYLRGKLKAQNIAEGDVCNRYSVETIEDLNLDAFDELKSELLGMS